MGERLYRYSDNRVIDGHCDGCNNRDFDHYLYFTDRMPHHQNCDGKYSTGTDKRGVYCMCRFVGDTYGWDTGRCVELRDNNSGDGRLTQRCGKRSSSRCDNHHIFIGYRLYGDQTVNRLCFTCCDSRRCVTVCRKYYAAY